jgi:uncharacterized damage-inducible protein DinB
MNRTSHIRLMASYNAWMNEKIYTAARQLSPIELAADKHAFFGSILGTLNHNIVGDIVWLKRFALHPASFPALQELTIDTPKSLDQILFSDFESLYQCRKTLDEIITRWADAIAEPDLDIALSYKNMKGIPGHRNFYSLILHFFNHQTHHRGQLSTLLSQSGLNIGVTDLLDLIPNV